MRVSHLLCILLFLNVMRVSAQYSGHSESNQPTGNQPNQDDEADKGSFLTVSGSFGSSAFDYKLSVIKEEKGDRESIPGYGFELKYSYFMDVHWGVSTGVGISHYGAKGKLSGSMADDKYYELGKLVDNDIEGRPRNFEMRARLKNLEEKQTAYFIEVPIMGVYQTRFGDSKRWGLHAGLGIKLQFPVNAKFKIQNGTNSQLNISGFYPDIPADKGSPGNPPVPHHGFGTITNPNESLDWNDNAKLKMGIAATADIGVMYQLSDGMDLMLGGYIDYGLNDLKKKANQGLLTPPSIYHPAADNFVGKGITYHGMLNSNATDKIKLISFGGKISLRFKL